MIHIIDSIQNSGNIFVKNSTWIKVLFWITIMLGVILPIIGRIAEDMKFREESFLFVFKSAISFFLRDGWMLLTWVWQDIPFIFLAFFIRSRLSNGMKNAGFYKIRVSEAIGAWIVPVTLSVLVYLEVLFSSKPLSGSSLSSLIYLFLPFYGIIAILVGYGCGTILGRLLFWIAKGDKKGA